MTTAVVKSLLNFHEARLDSPNAGDLQDIMEILFNLPPDDINSLCLFLDKFPLIYTFMEVVYGLTAFPDFNHWLWYYEVINELTGADTFDEWVDTYRNN